METKKENEDHLNDLLEDALSDLLSHEGPDDDTFEDFKEESSKKSDELTGGVAGPSGNSNLKLSDKELKKAPQGLNNFEQTFGSGSGGGGLDIDEREMNKFFENMTAQLKAELPKIDPKEAQEKINESVPQIFDLMQNLLSKELLYPALTSLSPKFCEFLEKNASSLSKADKRRFRKQKDIINEIIEVFDDESLDDKEKFEKNLDLMERMQALGSPPEELTVPDGMGRCGIM